MVCESLDVGSVTLATGTSWSPGQCLCRSCLRGTVLAVEDCTGHGLGALTKGSLFLRAFDRALRHRSCKAPVGGLYREGEESKMFCSFLSWLEIKKIYQNQKQFSSLSVR